MRSKLIMLPAGFAFMLPLLAWADPVFVLAPAAQTGTGSNEVCFAAAITNTVLADNSYLNDLQVNFTGVATNYLAADTNVFFANVPGILLSGETYTGAVFGVTIQSSTPPGDYSGVVTMMGGTNIFATNILASQPFQILVPPSALNLAVSGTNCILSWPSPPGNFALQESSDLTAANWTTLTNAPITSNGWNEMVLPPPVGSYFYRLAYP